MYEPLNRTGWFKWIIRNNVVNNYNIKTTHRNKKLTDNNNTGQADGTINNYPTRCWTKTKRIKNLKTGEGAKGGQREGCLKIT